ncbi:MAG: YhfC family glutamic-type intramembrane protease [Romboutsia sp.]
MIESSVIVSLAVSTLICFLIPIISFIYFAKKHKKVPKSFLVGMLIFFVSQMLIRIPILIYILPNMMWFIKMQTNPYIYGIFLGLTAGIFEEVGRYVAFKYLLKNNREFDDGISYGFGHGGIEAILLTGVSCLSTLIICIIINNGTININSSGALSSLYNQCISLTPGLALISGIERISAMAIHIGLSMIVLYGVRNRKMIYLFIAILVHTLINAPLVIFPQVFGVGIVGVEIYVFICGLVLAGFSIYSKKLYQKDSLTKNL